MAGDDWPVFNRREPAPSTRFRPIASSSPEVGHDGRAMNLEALCEVLDRGAGVSVREELVNLWGSEAGLFPHSPATLRGVLTTRSGI